MAVFTALAYATYFLEIPIFAATPASFLKLDFSCVFILLAGFMYGPLPAIIITIIKEALHIPVGTTMGVGELANVIMTLAYVIVPTTVYTKRKGIKIVLITLAIGSLLQIGVALLVNRFINYPFFAFMFGGSIFGFGVKEFFATTWWLLILFNIIKAVSVSFITLLLYKRVSALFKRINLQNN
jgi:riboflavin transporter FmnP